MRLKDKVAIVTGSSRGIGRSIALTLAENGADLVVTYNSNEEKAKEVVDKIKDIGRKAIVAKVDISKRDEVKNMVKKTVNKYNKLDIIVNNAGILQQKPFEQITGEEWDEIFAVNMRGTFICCQEVIPHMKKNGYGRIINISSIGGQWGGNLAVHYSATKAGIISLTRSLARIYSDDGINTNCVAPGLVMTDMIRDELETKEGREKLESIPIGRAADPKEMGKIVAFLASDEASYITGQTINANGGMFFST